MSGFSISNNLLANEVNLELSEHQQTLGASVRDLSSGLRVNDAADDPSGNAIATSLQTHSQAFNQASQNVSNAQNAGAVADGALAAVTDILLRIRELAVGAASTVDSSSDRVDIQAEIDQLLLEINRIAQDTNFNGRSLLNGSIAGYQPAQSAQALTTANSVLISSSANGSSNAPSSYLLAGADVFNDVIQPAIAFGFAQNVTASAAAQTVMVDSTQALQPGDVYGINDSVFTVQSVDAANDTITAVFAKNITQGQAASSIVNTNVIGPIAVGTHQVTLANPSPIFAGETIQINYGSIAQNDVVVVAQVLSSISFIATFNKAQPGIPSPTVYATNDIGVGPLGPGTYDYSFGTTTATDGSPIGSTAYVVATYETIDNVASSTVTKIVGTGTVVGGNVENSDVYFPTHIGEPPGFNEGLTLYEPLGLGTVPLVNTVDGTIKLAVVNQSGTIGVQETFYNTATQTSVTSPYLLAPGERAMLYDGVVTKLGDFGATDVGSTAYIKVLQSVAAITSTSNPALQVQSGADEGDLIQIAIPAVNTNTLRVSTVTVIGASGTDPTLAAEDSIGQLDYALQQVTTTRAQIGSEIVRLGIDQTNDNTAATELTASQSNITDLNVGTATTAFTAQQIEIDVATSLLAQVNNLPDEILKLFPPP
ncbi:MAG TPA: flagellin [Verrucomicrobiae bacterium]|nr:flagellin [Verrucomicrobiae bacterium]